MANQEEKELKEIFKIINSEPTPARIDDSFIKKLAESENKNKHEVPRKVLAIKRMISVIEKKLNSMLGIGAKYTLPVTFSSNPSSGNFDIKIAIMNTNSTAINSINMNIKLDKLIKLPAEEIYTILSTAVYGKILSQKIDPNIELENKEVSDKTFMFFKGGEAEERQLKAGVKEKKDKIKATSIISAYLEEFIKQYFGDDFNDFGPIASYVATDIVNSMDENDLQAILSNMFDFEKINEVVKGDVSSFLNSSRSRDKLLEARSSNIVNKAKLALNEHSLDEALNYNQQYEALLNERTKDSFKKMVESDTLQPNADLRNFCIDYVNSFMNSNGLHGAKVTFENTGDLGTFYHGDGRININLTRLSQMESCSVSELVMTLSHELTHAVDYAKNTLKADNGIENRSTGFVDDISESIKDANLEEGSKQHELLKTLNSYCYHINPNERRARIGELSALKFMESLQAESGLDSEQIEQSRKNHQNYQKQTIEIADAIKGKGSKNYRSLEELMQDYQSIRDSLTPTQDKFFTERIKYLERFAKNDMSMSNSMEEEYSSIEATGGIVPETTQQEQWKNKEDNERKEQERQNREALRKKKEEQELEEEQMGM